MEKPLTYLKQRAGDDWLVGFDSHEFVYLTEQLLLELTPLLLGETPPKILLAYREPLQFLAGFIAATTVGCPVFLCNPNWVKAEWQQVFDLVQPDLIWGQEAIANKQQKNSLIENPKSKIQNPIMIPTGGSSGQIRFAIHTWETLMASVQGFRQYFGVSAVNSFCVLPLYHVSGLMQFMRSLTTCGRLVIMPFKSLNIQKPGFSSHIDPKEFFISLVPTQLQRLLHQNPTWLSRFHTVLLGGAPAWLELLETARHHRIRLAPTYGMTETASQIVTLNPVDFLKGTNNCGQVLPHAKVTIRNSNGEILDTNKTGIITIQADSLALGYYPDLFNETQHFQVDDLGFFDDQGFLNVVGRNSNKIITGGENVFPDEIEAAIRATQLVTDVCALGLPDTQWGQVVTAVYVPIHPEISIATLQTALEDKLSSFKQPKYWIPLESLPRNLQGKLNREQLQEIAISQIQSQ
jgi:O-succinylbenzoic acid--CoA ligase